MSKLVMQLVHPYIFFSSIISGFVHSGNGGGGGVI